MLSFAALLSRNLVYFCLEFVFYCLLCYSYFVVFVNIVIVFAGFFAFCFFFVAHFQNCVCVLWLCLYLFVC